MKKVLTLLTIFDEEGILLGMKKRGFGEGWWNGFGGKVESGETIEQAAKRELREEISLIAEEIDQRGILTFTSEDSDVVHEVHVYKIISYSGGPEESEER